MKIQGQLIRLVLAALLPAALAVAVLIVHSYQRQRSNVEHNTLETTRTLTQAVDRELASGRTALQALATSPYLAAGDLAAFHRQAREALRGLPGNNVVVTDASGQQLLNTLRPFGEPLPPHANQAQVRRVFATGRSYISDLYVGAVTRRPLVGIDVPVRRDGVVVYDMTMGIFPSQLGQILKRGGLPATWVAVVLDSQGTIVARTHDADRYVGQKAVPALVRQVAVAQPTAGQIETNTLEGIPVRLIFSRSSESSWSVAIGIPQAEFNRDLWASIGWLIVVTALLLVLGMALAQAYGARIARSIRGLIPPAHALGLGEAIVIPPLELEEAEEVALALVSASRMLRDREEILAVVTHDLRNPLFTLTLGTATAELMAARLPGGEALHASIGQLGETARRMSGMVDDLLAVCVSTGGTSTVLNVADVDAASLVERAVGAVRPLFEREGIDLRVNQAGPLPHVRADPDRLLRVFVNLLDNALKFTQRPGEVIVHAEALPDAVRFCVDNSGPALTAQELASMFRPFWQAGDDRRGVGLGLSICRSIIETHGGRIWAEPQPGMRVRVCFEVQRSPSGAVQVSAAPVAGPAP